MTIEEEAIEFCKKKASDAWWKLAIWLKEGDRLTRVVRSQCGIMGRALGQNREPSANLSVPCMKNWEDANSIGWNNGDPEKDDDD